MNDVTVGTRAWLVGKDVRGHWAREVEVTLVTAHQNVVVECGDGFTALIDPELLVDKDTAIRKAVSLNLYDMRRQALLCFDQLEQLEGGKGLRSVSTVSHELLRVAAEVGEGVVEYADAP